MRTVHAVSNLTRVEYCTCTKKILKGPGQTDADGGAGTASFANEATDIYCK